MKKIFLLTGMVVLYVASFAQKSDGDVKTQVDTYIRNAQTAGSVTRSIVSDAFQSLIDGKINRSETLVTTGTNDYTITPTFTPDYTRFPQFLVRFVNGNTGAVTVNTIPVKKNVAGVMTALSSGDIPANGIYWIVYDGTQFQINLGATGGGTFVSLSDGPGAFTGKSLNFVRVNTGETALEYQTPSQVKTDLSLTKSDVGLSNVDNTSDATKNSASAVLTNKDLTSGTNTFPTFNQNTTGSAGSVANSITVDNSTLQLNSGTTYDGSAAKTISVKDGGVTNAKLANSSITVAGNSTALGTSVTQDQITGLSSTGLIERTGANTLAVASRYVFDESSVSTASGTITLNLNSQIERMFVGSATFSSAKTIALSNTSNALVFRLIYTITNTNAVLTLPNDWKLNTTYFSNHILVHPTIGTFKLTGFWDGSNWQVDFSERAYN